MFIHLLPPSHTHSLLDISRCLWHSRQQCFPSPNSLSRNLRPCTARGLMLLGAGDSLSEGSGHSGKRGPSSATAQGALSTDTLRQRPRLCAFLLINVRLREDITFHPRETLQSPQSSKNFPHGSWMWGDSADPCPSATGFPHTAAMDRAPCVPPSTGLGPCDV